MAWGKAGKRKEMVKDWGGVKWCVEELSFCVVISCVCVRCVCVRVCVCVCACRSCDREGRKNKGGGEKDREVKNSCVDKVVYTYVCRQVSSIH